MRKQPGGTSDFDFHKVVPSFMFVATNRERFLTYWKDHKLDQPWLWCDRHDRHCRSRRTRLNVLQQGEKQAVGDVWRQLKPLGQPLLFAIVICVADGDLAGGSVDRRLHRMFERRTSLNDAVAQESEYPALRKYGRFLIDRTIFEAKCQMV